MSSSGHPVVPSPLPRARRTILTALVLSLLFEVANVIGTPDKTVYAVVPWHDDPYHAVLLAAMFTVAMVAVVLGARMLAWSAPGAADRARQMLRASGVLVAAIGIASGFQWAAVFAGAHAASWDGATTLQIVALSAATAWALVVAAALVTTRTAGRARWTDDWLGDAALLAARLPGLRRGGAPGEVVGRIRQRAIRVFAAVSVLVALPIVAAQAIGERWTDPRLIAWALVVLTATLFAFGVIANALAGFISRPPRSRTRRIAEASLVAGCLAIQISEAFHDQIWRALTGHPVGTVAALVALTTGSGLVGAAACAAAAPALSGGSGGAR